MSGAAAGRLGGQDDNKKDTRIPDPWATAVLLVVDVDPPRVLKEQRRKLGIWETTVQGWFMWYQYSTSPRYVVTTRAKTYPEQFEGAGTQNDR